MDQVRRVVSLASRRLLINDFLQRASIALAIGIALIILARIAERVLGLSEAFAGRWTTIFGVVASVALLAAFIASYVTRKRTIAVAQEVDERAGLRESLSTALYMEQAASTGADPWAKAMVETAATTAARVSVPVIVPIQGPRAWPAPFLAALAGLVVWYAVPKYDLLKREAKAQAAKQQQQELVTVKAEVAQAKDKLKEMLARATPELLEGLSDPQGNEQGKIDENDPEAVRRAAVRELTELTQRLDDAKLSEKALASEALREQLEQLKTPGPGPLDQFSRSLAKGDFSAAKDALDQVAKDMEDGQLSPEKAQQAKQQLENLAKQVQELVKDQKELTQKLQQQGLDQKTAQDLAKKAGDPSALEEALSKMPGLNDQQKNDLVKMAKAAQKANQACENMSQSMSKAAQGMSQEGLQNQGNQGMEDLRNQLSESEMTSQDMENLEAAMSEAKKQLGEMSKQLPGADGQCKNPGDGEGDKPGQGGEGEGGEGQGQDGTGEGQIGKWREGDSSRRGSGSGGAGQGQGRGPEAEPADFELDKKRGNVKSQKGAIIGSRLVYGEQIKGESVIEFAEAVEQGEQAAAEGIEAMRVPKEMENAVKAYFGRLKTKATEAKAPASKPAETKPADPKPADEKK
jgi:hypothetical protein